MIRLLRPVILSLVTALLLTSLPAAEPAPTTPLAHKRVLVLGDSITQDGRYVTFLEYYLHRLAPDAACDLLSIGLSSETVSGLSEATEAHPRPCALERLDRALKAAKPQLVLACYGMNDGIYHPSSPERLAAFEKGLHEFITKIRATGAELVLITPPIFDPLPIPQRAVPLTAPAFGFAHPFGGYDGVLAEFAKIETALHEPGVAVIDLHTAMAEGLIARRAAEPDFAFSKDGVHPQDAGHLLMARVIGSGLGLPLPATDLNAELARINADPLFALVSVRRRLRSEAWLPFVGYTRDREYKSASIDAEELVAARLLAEIEAVAGVKKQR